MSPEVLASAPVFAALGDPTRLRLLADLAERGPQSITGLAARTDVTRQAVTKHLHVLADAGLVRGSRRGREALWEVEPGSLLEARRSLDRLSEQWDQAIERLRDAVER